MCKVDSKDKPVSNINGANVLPDQVNGLNGVNEIKELDENEKDFLWVRHNEPHCSRRKQIMQSHPEVTKLMGYEPLTKYIVVALTAVHLALAIYLRDEALWGGTLKFWLLAYFIGATITQALFLAIHEISHNLAFKSLWANRMFGIFANITLLVPFFSYFKQYHTDHHKFQGVHGIDTDIPTRFEAKLLSNKYGKIFFLMFQTWFYAFRPMFVKDPIITRYHVLQYVVQIAFVSTIIHFFGFGPILYLLLSAHLAGSLHPMASHFIAEHYVIENYVAREFKDCGTAGSEDEDTFETFSYYGPLNWLAFNVGYHNEHHDFPSVPWSRLPQLHALLYKDYYSKLPFHESWPDVLVRFITDGKVSLFNRVKRKDKLPGDKKTE